MDFKNYEEFGQKWVKGAQIEEIELNGKKYVFNAKQQEFLNSTKKYCLCSGGFGSGKTLALLIKMILQSMCFPNNRLLLGRKHISDLERATIPELFELMPSKWYKHRVKDNIIQFANGSQIVMFGLDALQSGSQQDIKKAQQKLKSLNLGGYYIDQLEEIEEEVFKSLNSRLRRTTTPIRQGNMTCNPANFWAYYFFKVNKEERDDIHLIESSMMDNKANLPADYIEDQLKNDDSYIKRFVYGEWSMDLLLKGTVFSQEFINRMKLLERNPLRVEEECEIFERKIPGMKYKLGVDPSEGVVDPCSMSVISEEGKKVAKYSGYIPIPAQIEKVKFLQNMYDAYVIPEVNAAGAALLEGIKDLPIFKRKVFEYREKKTMEKLGWKTSYQSKAALISNFQDLVRKRFPQIFDHNTIEEFKTFIWTDSAKQKGAGAASGAHDDDVMSTLLGFWDLKPIDRQVRQLQQQINIKHNKKPPFQYR